VRLHAVSSTLDPASLSPGQDLVLGVDPAHGTALAPGVLAHDHLSVGERFRVDELALQALARWRARHDESLTIDELCLPFVWHYALYQVINPCLVSTLGLHAALQTYSPSALELMDDDPGTEHIAIAAASAAGVPVVRGRRRRAPPARGGRRRRPRPAAVAARCLTFAGAPTCLRRDSSLFLSYWPLMPLLDRALARRAWRPAIALQRRPSGPARSLRAGWQGGWLGLPSPFAIVRAAQSVALRVREHEAPAIEVAGVAAGPAIHAAALGVARRRAGADLAAGELTRRAFATRRVRRLVGTYDLDPYARLVVSQARNAGVRTFCLAHGAYLLPQPISDLELADEVAIWSPAIAPPIEDRSRPIHTVGYPLPYPCRPARRFPRGRPARVALVAQTSTPGTATVDGRIVMRHYEGALAAIVERLPDATVILRPHPSQGAAPIAALRARFPALRLAADGAGAIHAFLAAGDVCIGGMSAATLEAALVGTPVIVLNLTGFDWRWPLGGDTRVPVARSVSELAEWLAQLRSRGTLPGREDLLQALGANGGDPTQRLLDAIEGQGR
jgi:hypothetical protein